MMMMMTPTIESLYATRYMHIIETSTRLRLDPKKTGRPTVRVTNGMIQTKST